MKGEKVHKTPSYDAEMNLCFFSVGCFTVPCTRLVLGITLCCSRQSLNPEHVKGIEPSSLGNQTHTRGLSPALQSLKKRLAKKGCTVACIAHPIPQAVGKVCPSPLQNLLVLCLPREVPGVAAVPWNWECCCGCSWVSWDLESAPPL